MAIDCEKQGGNTGSGCVPPMLVLNNFIFVHRVDSTGALNEIDLTVDLDSTYFTARVNDPDPTKRWYPLAEMKNITDERGESLFESFADGSKERINQGTRSMTGLITTRQFVSPQMLGKIQSFFGVDVAAFGVDKSKALVGKVGSSATKLAPVELESGSLDAKLVKTTDTTVQKIMVMWDYDQLEDDSQLRVVQASEMSYDVSKLRGLIDVTGVASAISTTGLTITLKTDAGTLINPIYVEGLVITDFVSSVGGATSKVRNTTDGSDVAIATFSETAPGVYALTFLAQTSGDVIVVKPKKNGFDFSEVEALVIEIP